MFIIDIRYQIIVFYFWFGMMELAALVDKEMVI